MTEFNAVDYFNRRANDIAAQDRLNRPQDKLQQTESAVVRARDALLKSGTDKISEMAVRKVRNENSLTTVLGLDPDSGLGIPVNAAAHALAGFSSQVVAPVLAIPSDARAAAFMAGMDDGDLAAYSRYLKGTSTAEDRARLHQIARPTNTTDENQLDGVMLDAPFNVASWTPAQTPKLDSLIEADKSREIAKTIRDTLNIDYIKNTRATDGLVDQLRGGFAAPWDQVKQGWGALSEGVDKTGGAKDIAAGLGKLIYNAGEAAGDNKVGALNYVAENLPQLLVGAGKGGTAILAETNAGYAWGEYNKGIEKYRAENEGAFPPEAQRQEMAAWAASLALAEQVGDMTSLAKMVVKKPVVESAQDVVRTSFKKSLLNTTVAATQAAAVESATEGYQTWAEGQANLSPVSAEDIYVGTAIGGITGAAMTGGLRGAAELAQATPEHAAERKVTQTVNAAQEAAVTSGDVSALLNPKNAVYSPYRAIAALAGHSAQETTTPEQKQVNLEKATQVVADLQIERDQAQESVDKLSPEGLQALDAQIASLRADGKTDAATAFEEVATSMRETAKGLPALQKTLASVDERLNQAQEALGHFNTELNAGEVDVAAQVATINAPVEATDTVGIAARQKSVETLINLSMASKERLDPQVASSLAENTANGLSANQRTYLRAFSAARIAENQLKDMSDVSQEIYTGSDKNVGIAQYQDRMAAAVAAGNQTMADRQIKDLKNFEGDHKAKAALLLKAREESNAKGGEEVQVIRAAEKRWFINRDMPLSRKAMKVGGFASVHRGTPNKFITDPGIEAAAITAALSELQAAYAIKFSVATQEGDTNVTNVPQASDQAQDSVAGNQEVLGTDGAATAVSAGTTPAAPVGAASGTSAVEAAGVGTYPPNEYTNHSGGAVGADSMFDTIGRALGFANHKHYFHGRRTPKGNAELTDEQVNEGIKYAKSAAAVLGRPWNDKYGSLLGRNWFQVKNASQIIAIAPLIKSGEVNSKGFKSKAVRTTVDGGTGYAVEMAIANNKEVHVFDTKTNQWFEWKDGNFVASSVPILDKNYAGIGSRQDNGAMTPESVQAIKDVYEKVGQATQSTALPESAEQTSTQVEETVGTVEELTGESQSKDGTLEVMNRLTPGGSLYTQRNLIADFFTQVLAKVGDKTQRPLVSAKNFLTEVFTKETAKKFLGLDPDYEFTDQEGAALSGFEKFALAVLPKIKANLSFKGDARHDYWHEDLMQFFIKEDGGKLDIEENLKTAIAYAAFGYLAENATRPENNTNEEINAILLRDENHPVTDEERNKIGSIGTRQNVVINSLGQKVLQALGFKVAKHAPQDMLPRLTSALGAHVMKLLLDQGTVERSSVTAEELADLTNNEVLEKYKDITHQFLKLARQGKDLHTITEDAFASNRGSGNVLDRLFGVEDGMKDPGLKPVSFIQKAIRNTMQMVPKALAKIMAHENSQPNYLRMEMWRVVEMLSPERMLKIAGSVDVDTTKVHKINRDSMQAKNDGLRRELENFQDYVREVWAQAEDGVLSPIFLPHTVWKQQRVGIASNTVNPQTSKIHRHLLGRPSWKTAIDPNDMDQLENFKLRVAEGLGIKTDKKNKAAALLELEEKLQDPKIQAAVAVLRKIADLTNKEVITEGDQDTIVEGVAKGGESMHSFDTLVALAAETTDKPFEVTLTGEVDGVTNGPMLSNLLLGAANSAQELFGLLNRGGFYQVGSQHSNYNNWRGDTAAGNSDLYETTAGHMVQAVQGFIARGIFETKGKNKGKLVMPAQLVERTSVALYAFTGELADKTDGTVKKAGRDIIKTPLTAMTFGSSVSKAVDSMADKFIESIYAAIEKTAVADSKAMSREELIAHINTLLRMGNGNTLSPKLSIEQLMEGDFDKGQTKALKKVFKDVIGRAVESTMEKDFSKFMDRRAALNNAATLAFTLHNSLYQAMRQKLILELIEKDKAEPGTGIASRTVLKGPDAGKVIALHDLTEAQEKELRKQLADVSPVMHTYFSKQDGNLSAGLSVSKGSRKLSQKDTYSQEVKFGTKTPDGKQAVNTHGYEQVETAPGVAMVPMSTHSLDSAISHLAALLGEVLNVHDAHAAGVGTFQQTAKNLNASTWKALLNYSPATEMVDTLTRTLQGMAELVKQGALPVEALAALKDVLAKMNKGEGVDIRGTLLAMRQTAYEADKIKLEAMMLMQSIDQYALEDGQFLVEDSHRAEAAALLAKLASEVSEKDLQAVEAIEVAMEAAQVSTTEAEEQVNDLGVVEEAEAPRLEASPFGPVSKPTIESDSALVAFFKESPTATAKEVIQQLYGMLKGKTGRTSEFNQLLLKKLAQVVSPSLVFKFVTPATPVSDVLALPKEGDNARAWFVAKGFDEEIYVLSPEFANSGLTVETLIHELTHGALARIVARELDAEKASPKYRSEALELIGELEELRDKAKVYAKRQGFTQFDAALGDIQEFIAWGMSNQEFQRSVLSQVSMDSRTGTNELVNGLKMFINKLVGLLFKGSTKSQQEVATNGLTVLISNVSGLLSEAEQSGSNENINLSMASPMSRIQGYTTLDIHNALPQVSLSSAFDAQLQDLLSGIVQKLHGPFGAFKAALMQDRTITALDVWAKALNTGMAPFASKLKVSPILIRPREMHAMEQVEAVMRAALGRNETSATTAYKELGKLFLEMREVIKPSDFGSQAEYDFIFNIGLDAQGRSDHLARFAAFGLAHQEFNNLMKRATPNKSKTIGSGKGFAERFQIMFEKVLAFFHEKITHTYQGQQADEKLTKLVEQLVDIEARKLATIAQPVTRLMNTIEDGVKDVAEVIKDQAIKVAGSPFVRNNTNVFVQAVGGMARSVANNQVEWVLKGIKQIRDSQVKGKHGIMMQMLTEVTGPGKILNALSLASTSQQRHRKQVIDHTAKFSRQAFVNAGKKFTDEAKAAVTQVFMRTGMYVLMDKFNMVELEQLLGNPRVLTAEIKDMEKQLNGVPQYKEHLIAQANALAAYRMTGRNHAKILMMNAHNIARMYGFPQSRITEAEAKQVEPIIEKLVALYAIGYSGDKARLEAKNTLHSENQRSDGNGVEFVLRMHQKLDADARAGVFKGQEALMMHGFTPEITNPHTSVVVATKQEGEALLLLGYVQEAEVSKDPADPNREARFLFVQRDGGLAPYLTGIMSTTGMHTKGSTKHSGFLNVNTADGLVNASMQADIINGKGVALSSGPRRDLTKQGLQTYMAPVLNPQGEIVNWRYLMQDTTKDTVLERENDFSKVMGMLAGSIYDKESTPEINNKALVALRNMEKTDRKLHPDAYILVGPKSTDAQLRETWNLLPHDTRKQARNIWGSDGMWVRKDALTTIFGYRKFSLADAFSKDPTSRTKIEELYVGVMEHVVADSYRMTHPGKTRKEAEEFAKKTAVFITRGERGWQELVRATKDIIVVKSGVVMMGNVWSNLWLLKLSGVPLGDLVKHHLVALRGVRSYQADSDELARLQALIDTGMVGTKATQIQQEMARLTDSLERNPVKELIDAGLMPTIAEDMENEDPYSYKSSVVKATEMITDKLHPDIVSLGKTLMITHDTKLYQGLSRITQLSDFVARYTMYQHLTTRKENPLSKEDAIFEASESFVNYDIPMPKGMQYLDDMGITMFTKYFLRIQRVIMRMAQNNPAQVLMTIALDSFLDLGPIVLESSWLHKVGNNPLNWGALQLPGSVGELGTVAGAMALVK